MPKSDAEVAREYAESLSEALILAKVKAATIRWVLSANTLQALCEHIDVPAIGAAQARN